MVTMVLICFDQTGDGGGAVQIYITNIQITAGGRKFALVEVLSHALKFV